MRENTSKNGKRHEGRRYSAKLLRTVLNKEPGLKLSGQTGSKIIDSMDRLYLDQGGFMRYYDDSYSRLNAKLSIESEINKWLTVFGKTTFNNNNRSKPYWKFSDIDHTMFSESAEPLMPVYHPDGQYSGQGWWTNYVAIQKEGGYIANEVNDSWLTGGLKIKPIEGIVLNFDYTYNYYNQGTDTYVRTFDVRYADPDRVTPFPHVVPNTFMKQTYYNKYQAINLFAQFNKMIGESEFSGVIGFNQEEKSLKYTMARRDNLINNELPSLKQATGIQYVDEANKDWAIRGAFLRLGYVFDEKYLLEFNGRYDGSSRFPKDTRFNFFPSISAGWRISEEGFFEPITNIINELKIRASLSSLGNQILGSNYYPYISTLGTTSQISYIIGGTTPLAVTPGGLIRVCLLTTNC